MKITVKQLKQLVREVRSKGTWSDIDNGAGGSVYNRSQSRTRSPKQVSFDAGAQWDAMSVHDRLIMLNSEMDGYSSKDRVDLSNVSWAELPEQVGPDMMDEFARIVKHWNV